MRIHEVNTREPDGARRRAGRYGRPTTARSGLALRFARIARLREDKAPGQATTLEELRALYERQFTTKGRASP